MLGRSRCCAPSNLLRRAAPAAAESRTSRLGSHTMPATTGRPGSFGGDGSKLMGSCKEKCMASINAVDDRSACKGTPASCRSRVPSASTASAVYFFGTSYAQCATCASFAARISDPSAAGDNDLNTAYCARSAMAQALPLTMTVGVAVQCSRNCDTVVFKPHWCFLEQMPAMSRYPARSSRKPPSLPLSLSPSLPRSLSLSRSPSLSLSLSLSLSPSLSRCLSLSLSFSLLFPQVMTTPAESPLAPSSGSSLLAIASSTPSSGPGPAQASKPGLAQPSPPTPRRTNPKTWFAKENVFGQNVSVKTFRSERFGQNFRSKLIGTQTLNSFYKPLNPKP